MVSKSLINKILTNVIVGKCKYGKIIGYNTLPPLVMSSLNHFYEIKHNNPIEEGFVFDERGELISTFNGTKDHVLVPCTKSMEKDLKEGHRLHLTHNHPSERNKESTTFRQYYNCFSDADMNQLLRTVDIDGRSVPIFDSITCESPYGMRMTLTNTNNNLPDIKDFEKARDNLLKNNKDFGKRYFEECQKYYEENIFDIPLEKIVSPDGVIITQYKEPLYSQAIEKFHKWQYNYSKKYYQEYIENSIDEFKNIGCELSIRYL